MRIKYAEVELIILDEISMVSEKVFYQMHCISYKFLLNHLLVLSILVAGDFRQLPRVRAMLVYASSLDADHPESYIANDLWRMFSFAELTEVMRQRRDEHLIDFLNKIRVGYVDSEVERTRK